MTDLSLRKWAFFASAILALLPALAMAETLHGVVTLSNPVSHATIEITDANGRVLAEKQHATDETGYFSIELPKAPGGELRVEAAALHGAHLYADVPSGSDLNSILVHVNVATTLVEQYRELAHVDQQRAEARVREFLELPSTLDLGADIDNPYLTIFSPGWYEHAAHAEGGFDPFTESLAMEMMRDPEATRSFASHGGQHGLPGNPASWIAEKLAAGVIGSIGSQIFGKLQNGIGIPDKQSQIFDLLTQVMAQINYLQEQMSQLEKTIKEGNYNDRMQKVWDEWGEISKLVSAIQDQNTQALKIPNDNSLKSKEDRERIAKNIQGYEQKINDKADDFITHVNTRFVVGGDGKPVQQLYAEVLFHGVVDSDYLARVDAQVERYRSLQIVALTLLVDTLRAEGNESAASTAIKTNRPLIDAVHAIYPGGRIFTLKHTLDRIKAKDAIYDQKQDLLFEMSYRSWDSWTGLQNYKKHHTPGFFIIPSLEQIRALLNDVGGLQGSWAEMARKLGFSAKDANDIRMVVYDAYKTNPSVGRSYVYYDWWGNNLDPRQKTYHDQEYYFDKARKELKMGPGFFTLKAIIGKELTD